MERMSHLQQDSEELLSVSWAAAVARIHPINVQSIEAILPQKLYGRLDEGLVGLSSGHHVGESGVHKSLWF